MAIIPLIILCVRKEPY